MRQAKDVIAYPQVGDVSPPQSGIGPHPNMGHRSKQRKRGLKAAAKRPWRRAAVLAASSMA